ncbi:hypothetical protein CLV85_2072 [Salinibacterium amurskyense]|uniref:Uncharacterized protein n=1 Tax=Salinibacterium amurskyense TaxID=205941 RepID=A0A2M9D2S6_9MICO|nr:hypothetical protein [Salinibacterium amurskyense]PJJ78497.1 hypothetical protein CLV85_2072 [Salinibacterium amurskyense]RLQ80591.1 hypothetical protein D9C83_10280 [Salinibacterium amurskyense]GHD83133.1 hypothetical protein GCM10007394_21750 [Salinibacterium amurskyense]
MTDSPEELHLPGFIAESEVLPPGKGLGWRLLALLVGLGLLIGIAVAGGAALFTALWPTTASLCDASSDTSDGTCSDVSLEQIAEFSKIDLPAETEVESVQYATVDGSFGLLYATVVLPEGAADPLRSGDYRVAPTLSWAAEADALGLDNLLLYQGVESVTGLGFEAASGQRADGRTVILIRVNREL